MGSRKTFTEMQMYRDDEIEPPAVVVNQKKKEVVKEETPETTE